MSGTELGAGSGSGSGVSTADHCLLLRCLRFNQLKVKQQVVQFVLGHWTRAHVPHLNISQAQLPKQRGRQGRGQGRAGTAHSELTQLEACREFSRAYYNICLHTVATFS